MNIHNPSTFDYIKEYNGAICRLWVKEIGAWNMDATQQVVIAHPFTITDVICYNAYILNDAQTYYSNLNSSEFDLITLDGVVSLTDTQIMLNRTAGKMYDSAQYDDAVMNRGYIHIWYKD